MVTSIYQCYSYLLTLFMRRAKYISFVYSCIIEFFDIYAKQ